MSTTTEPRPAATAVEKRNQELATNAWQMLNGMKSTIAAVLPKHLTPERMAMIAFTAMRRTPKLLLCSRESIIGSIMTASMLGLEPSGPLGHGALIPYGTECQFQPMYQGLLELARRSGFIKDVQLRAVYKGDHYLYRFGLDPTIEHIPMEGEGADSPDREPTHFYAIVRLTNGGVQWDQMSFDQGISHGRRFSPSYDSRARAFKPGSVWADNPEAMILKTILKKVLKLCPKSPELAAALQVDDLADTGKTTNMTKVGDGVFDIDIAEPAPPADQHQIEPAKAASAIDRIVDQHKKPAETPAETKPASPAPAASEPAGPAQAAEPSADPERLLTEDEWMDLDTVALDKEVEAKAFIAYVRTLGYKMKSQLKRKDYERVHQWLRNGGRE